MKAAQKKTIDPSRYAENRQRHPLTPQQSARYVGQWLAWDGEGKKVLAHAKNLRALQRGFRQKESILPR